MKRHWYLLTVCILSACGRGGNDYVDGIIVFDNAKEYPELDLKLSDVADLSYIPLKSADEVYLVEEFSWRGNYAYVDGDEVYLTDSSTSGVFVFDTSGNPLRKLSRPGRGPGEYGQGLLDFWPEPERNSVCVIGTTNVILEYDIESFEFLNTYQYGSRMKPSEIISLNRDYSIGKKKPRFSETDLATSFYIYSKPDWKPQPLPPKMERPFDFDDSFMLPYPGVTYGLGGVFMNDTLCDTVFWIDRATLEVRPRLVDKSGYPGRNRKVLPSFETDRYLFFSLVYQRFEWNNDLMNRVPINLPWPEERMFVFDKQKEKIFRIPINNTPIKVDNGQANDTPVLDQGFAWAFDECWLTCWNTTLNENYGIAMYQPWELIENMDMLPGDLKKIAATLKEDDNPVLALIKFR